MFLLVLHECCFMLIISNNGILMMEIQKQLFSVLMRSNTGSTVDALCIILDYELLLGDSVSEDGLVLSKSFLAKGISLSTHFGKYFILAYCLSSHQFKSLGSSFYKGE